MTNTATAQKVACHLTRGDVIRHNRRTYLVTHVGLAVVIPRSRLSERTSRSVLNLTLKPTRQGGGNSTRVRFEQDALVTVVGR